MSNSAESEARFRRMERVLRLQWAVIALGVVVGVVAAFIRPAELPSLLVVPDGNKEPNANLALGYKTSGIIDRLHVGELVAQRVTVGDQNAPDRIELFARNKDAAVLVWSDDREVVSIRARRDFLDDSSVNRAYESAVRLRSLLYPEVSHAEVTSTGFEVKSRQSRLRIMAPRYSRNAESGAPPAGYYWLDFVRYSQ